MWFIINGQRHGPQNTQSSLAAFDPIKVIFPDLVKLHWAPLWWRPPLIFVTTSVNLTFTQRHGAHPAQLCAVPGGGAHPGVALGAGVLHRPRPQRRHLGVDRDLGLAAVRDLRLLEHLDLAEAEVLPVHAVVADVDELAELAPTLVTLEPHELLVEPALELGAGLVLRRVAVQDLHHEDGELLVGAGTHGHPHALNHRVVLELNLKELF